MGILEKPIEYRPSRPPTAVYPDQHQVARYRDAEFPPTATDWERIFSINLEGGFFSPGALKEMILPLGQSIRIGAYGSAALVIVTTDDAVIEFLEALAEKHELPIFISSAPDAPLSRARPIGAITASEIQTYGLIRSAGGEVTSSRIADLAGIEVNAAVNRLSALAKKGYLQRVSRPRREGDAFIDLLSVAQVSSAVRAETELPKGGFEFSIPEEVRSSVQVLAEKEGVDPSEVLRRAWGEFLDRHRDVLDSESNEVRRMLKENDREGLAAYASRHNRERAKQAAARIKR